MDHAAFWWRHVSGPDRLLGDLAEAAFRHRVLLIEEPPFREEFGLQFRDRLLQRDSNLLIAEADGADVAGGIDAGEWLMRQCGRDMEYHPLDGSRAEVLAKRKWLAGRVFIIPDVQDRPEWVELAVEYARRSPADNGLLVLLYRGACPLASPRKGVAVFRRGDYFTAYDMQWFAAFCIPEKDSGAVRDYRAQVLARIAGGDPELCADLAREDVRSDPLESMEALAWRYPVLSDLAADRKRLELMLWEAQLQIVFPLVERLRRRFIDVYRAELSAVLREEDGVKDEFGNKLAEPEDMEIRHIWWYCFKKNKAALSESDRRVFHLIYISRNRLAHLKPVDHANVMELLMLDEYEPQRA